MLSSTPPQSVAQNLARTKSYLKREDTVRALDTFCVALSLYVPAQLLLKGRAEVETHILECVLELNRQARVKKLIKEISKSDKAHVVYTPGAEAKLASILMVIRKALLEEDKLTQASVTQVTDDRRQVLWNKGTELVVAGDTARGKAQLRRLADEFGEEPGILAKIGAFLQQNKLLLDAIEFLEQSVAAFPKESAAYGPLVNCYIDIMEYEKAEALYDRHIRQFGPHAHTMVNLANLYMKWGKRFKGVEAAEEALRLDSDNAEAKEILAQVERK